MNHIRLHLLQILRLEICERGRLSKPRTVRLQFQHAFLTAAAAKLASSPRPSLVLASRKDHRWRNYRLRMIAVRPKKLLNRFPFHFTESFDTQYPRATALEI